MEWEKPITLQVYRYSSKTFFESDKKEHIFLIYFWSYNGKIHAYTLFIKINKYLTYIRLQFFNQKFGK